MMNLYLHQHQFYCGVDLHANNLHAYVVDADGSKRMHANFNVRDTDGFLKSLRPFRKNLVVGCESTFNWYWLSDLGEARKILFVLGHALYLKAIHGGKVKNDKIDSEKLAYLLRGGNFAVAYAYPAAWRSTRDLLRRRMHLVRRRGETLTHITHLVLRGIWWQVTKPSKRFLGLRSGDFAAYAKSRGSCSSQTSA